MTQTPTTTENPAIERMWDAYRRVERIDTLPPYEQQAYRKIFFDGACALAHCLAKSVIDDPMAEDPSDEDLDNMLEAWDAVTAELREYVAGGPLRGN